MRRRTFLSMTGAALGSALGCGRADRTRLSIQGEEFHINGRPTYEGRTFRGMKIQGLLMNSRVVQGIFDDLNPETRHIWRYPDTGEWDPERNTREFIEAMPSWRAHGLLNFTINLQGGRPVRTRRDNPWHNSAFEADGTLRSDFMGRLARILDKADELGMAPIVGYYYFGQDQRLTDEEAVKQGVTNATHWLLDTGHDNLLVEVNNECNHGMYHHEILKPPRVHELILLAKSITRGGRRLPVSTSYGGGFIPLSNVVEVSDFLLLHGNNVSEPERIAGMVDETRRVPSYQTMPILFNEDDHFDFDKPVNNMLMAVSRYASWGYFDPGENNYRDGYQSPPVNWGINTETKKAFFGLLKEMTGEG